MDHDDCLWLTAHQDLRPCRGCNKYNLQYLTMEIIYNRGYKIKEDCTVCYLIHCKKYNEQTCRNYF